MIRVLYLEAPVVVCSDFQCQELLGCTRKGRRKSETQCFKPCVLLIVFARVHKEARGFLKGGTGAKQIIYLFPYLKLGMDFPFTSRILSESSVLGSSVVA